MTWRAVSSGHSLIGRQRDRQQLRSCEAWQTVTPVHSPTSVRQACFQVVTLSPGTTSVDPGGAQAFYPPPYPLVTRKPGTYGSQSSDPAGQWFCSSLALVRFARSGSLCLFLERHKRHAYINPAVAIGLGGEVTLSRSWGSTQRPPHPCRVDSIPQLCNAPGRPPTRYRVRAPAPEPAATSGELPPPAGLSPPRRRGSQSSSAAPPGSDHWPQLLYTLLAGSHQRHDSLPTPRGNRIS